MTEDIDTPFVETVELTRTEVLAKLVTGVIAGYIATQVAEGMFMAFVTKRRNQALNALIK
jgi:hypothetical protein